MRLPNRRSDRLKALGHQTGCGSSRRWPPAARTSARSPARWAWQRPRCRGTWVQVCAPFGSSGEEPTKSTTRPVAASPSPRCFGVFGRLPARRAGDRKGRSLVCGGRGLAARLTIRAPASSRRLTAVAVAPGYGRSVQPSWSGHRAMIRSATSSARVPSVLYTSPTPPRPGMLSASSWA